MHDTLPMTKQEAIAYIENHPDEFKGDSVGPHDPKVISFRAPHYLKVWLENVALYHDKKIGEQMITSIEDGLFLQYMVVAVSNLLEEVNKKNSNPLFPGEAVNKPGADECLRYISAAVWKAIEEDRKKLEE